MRSEDETNPDQFMQLSCMHILYLFAGTHQLNEQLRTTHLKIGLDVMQIKSPTVQNVFWPIP